MNIKEFLDKAKSLNAKIELVIEADANDADYVYASQQYSVEEFEKENIFDDYNKLKSLEKRDSIWHIIAKKALDEWNDRDNFFYGEIVLTSQDYEIIKDYNKYCEYIPYNICSEDEPVHTINSVSLRLVIPFED